MSDKTLKNNVPSVSLEEFRALYLAYIVTLENARDRIIFLGGDCDSLNKMESGDPALIRARNVMGDAK